MSYYSPDEEVVRSLRIKQEQLERAKIRRQKLKRVVLTHYGNGRLACVCCGEKDIDFLTIDHFSKDAKEFYPGGGNFYGRLRKYGFPEGLQTMCYNCNFAKRTSDMCPHEIKRETKKSKKLTLIQERNV